MITTINLTNPTPRSSARSVLLLTAAILVCFALSVAPKAFGISAAREGGYPNQKEINALTTSFQLVSNQLERSKAAAELIADNH
jgi:hypothetical protein